tara:strand:- start:2215 stop:3528 length:1314 start_codon:yes stop_codon:yes gene_type:complete
METPAEAMTHLLAFGRKKLRAMSSRSYRVVSPSTNTSSAPLNSVVEFKIPGNQMAAFLDNNSCYFKFNVKNTDDAENFSFEGKCGAYGLIKKFEILTAGQTIDTIDEYGVLFSAMADTDSSTLYAENNGKILYGADSDAFAGNTPDLNIVAAGGTRIVCLPLVLNSLANSRKYIPLFSRDNLTIRLTLNDITNAGISTDTAANLLTNTQIVLDQPELVYNVVELSADAFQAVSASVDNVFQIVSDTYRHTSSNVGAAASQTHIANLGFAFSSLNRVIICQRETAKILVNTAALGNRCVRGLVQANLLLNGASIPERPIKIGTSCATALAETLVADRSLVAYDSISRVGDNLGYKAQTPSGASGNVGAFVLQIDTESMRSESDDPGIYAGVSTIGSVLQAQLEYGAANNVAIKLDFFAQFTQLLTLDMNASQTFIASV